MDFYRMTFKDDEALGVGKAQGDSELFFPPYEGEIDNWSELVLALQDGDYPDYLSSDFGGRICSTQLREVFDKFATEYDQLQWLSVRIEHKEEVRQYHFLHFPFPPNVLHPKKTIFAEGNFVVKPVLNGDVALSHAVFAYPMNEGTTLIVNGMVKKELCRLGLTGFELHKMPGARL